jgi:hypothetical protein
MLAFFSASWLLSAAGWEVGGDSLLAGTLALALAAGLLVRHVVLSQQRANREAEERTERVIADAIKEFHDSVPPNQERPDEENPGEARVTQICRKTS